MDAKHHNTGHPLLDAFVNSALIVLVLFFPRLYDSMIVLFSAPIREFFVEGREVILFVTAVLVLAKVIRDFAKKPKE